ncbi:EAL domain-containing protein [Mycoplasmatota bacterium WC44]
MVILDKHQVAPSMVTIEITEQSLVRERGLENIRKFKEQNMNIAIDDFSVGHSSLTQLSDISADIIKIDKSLLDKVNVNGKLDSDAFVIYKTIVELGKHLRIKIVSEGVETLEEINILKELNVSVGQGYYYSKPISKEEYVNLLKK